jgi:hypothetical protein
MKFITLRYLGVTFWRILECDLAVICTIWTCFPKMIEVRNWMKYETQNTNLMMVYLPVLEIGLRN